MGITRSAKEIARHLLYRVGLRRKEPHLAHDDLTQRFSDIYEHGVWTLGSSDVPLSGTGSTLHATESFRTQLPALVETLGAKTLLDVGCGDYTWMSKVALPCDYIGLDIVPWLIERNQAAFGSDTRTFLVKDIVAERAPEADLVLCREVLFHLSLQDGVRALRNMLESGCSHLLLTNDSSTVFNSDIDSGDFRLINLCRRPYGLPAPEQKIDDGQISKGRYVGIWRADTIRDALA